MGFRFRAARLTAICFCIWASHADAQPVLLQIKPRVGDTLHVKLDHEVAMRGVPQGCANQASALRAPAKSSSLDCSDVRDMSMRMEVYSRAIARRATKGATDMIAITDSVVTSPGGGQKRLRQPTPRGPVEIRVATDGSVEIGSGTVSDELRTMFGQMPATLSPKPVAVGEKWIHEMRIPLPDEPGAMGRVRTTLRLDSLSRNGEIAYISMRGVLSHDHTDGTTSETKGSLTGTMQLNRRLAWITATQATIDVWSVVKNISSGKLLDVHTRVVQSLEVTGSR